MFDIGWTEMLVISVIALLVVGPKDLPTMLRTVGQYVGKAKRMAREFQSQFDDAVRDSDLDEVRKSFEDLKSANPTGEIGKALSPLTEAADDLKSTVEKSGLDAKTPEASIGSGGKGGSKPENSILAASGPSKSAGKKSTGGKADRPAASSSAKKSAKPKKAAAAPKAKSKPKKPAAKKPAPAKKAAIANG